MIDKFKNWLGIEGVKLRLVVPEEVGVSEGRGFVDGRIIFASKYKQTVTSVALTLVERYSRGRGEDRKTDEYELGRICLDAPLEVPAYEEVSLDFALPFQLATSNVDDFEAKNPLAKGLVRLAKSIHQVESEYRVLAQAKVQGTALNPFAEAALHIG